MQPPFNKIYAQSSAPHIHDSETVAGIYWKWAFACAPLVIAAILAFRLEALRTISVSVVSGLAIEWLTVWIFAGLSFLIRPKTDGDNSKNRLKKASLGLASKQFQGANGSTLYFSLILALLLPAGLPAWMIIAGNILAIGFFKELTGGIGSYPFQPAVAAVLLLGTIFPQRILWEGLAINILDWKTLLFNSHASLLGSASLLAAVIAGALLVLFKLIRIELSLFYFLGAAVISEGLNRNGWAVCFHPPIWTAAFFLITDYSSLPMTARGRKIFAFAAGALGVFLEVAAHQPAGIFAAIILVSACSPWFDAWTLPKGIPAAAKKNQERRV